MNYSFLTCLIRSIGLQPVDVLLAQTGLDGLKPYATSVRSRQFTSPICISQSIDISLLPFYGANMDTERDQRLPAAAKAILSAQGDLDPEMRRTAMARAEQLARAGGSSSVELPEPLGRFVDKVAKHAYKVTDSDIEALHAAGYSDDAILEAVISTAIGAGLSRLEIGLAALRGGS